MLIFYFWSDFERVFMCSFWWDWHYKRDSLLVGVASLKNYVCASRAHYRHVWPIQLYIVRR
jgi:hypothetical protein